MTIPQPATPDEYEPLTRARAEWRAAYVELLRAVRGTAHSVLTPEGNVDPREALDAATALYQTMHYRVLPAAAELMAYKVPDDDPDYREAAGVLIPSLMPKPTRRAGTVDR